MANNISPGLVVTTAEQDFAFQALEVQFLDSQNEFRKIQTNLARSEREVERLHQELLDKDASVERLREEVRHGGEQAKLTEANLATSLAECKALQKSLELERAEREAALEGLRAQRDLVLSSRRDVRACQEKAAQHQGALSKEQAIVESLHNDKNRLESEVSTLTAELGQLQASLLQERLDFEGSIAGEAAKGKEREAELQELRLSEERLRERCISLERAKENMMSSSKLKDELWGQKEGEMQQELERLVAKNAELKEQALDASSANASLRGMLEEVTQQTRDMENSHRESLRRAREEVAAAQQRGGSAGCAAGAAFKWSGSSLGIPGKGRAGGSVESRGEFSLHSVRSASHAEMFIKFSELLEAYHAEVVKSRQGAELVEFVEEQHRVAEEERAAANQKCSMMDQTCVALRTQVQTLSRESSKDKEALRSMKDQLRSARVLREVAEASAVDLNDQVCALLKEVHRLKSASSGMQSHSVFSSVATTPRSTTIDDLQHQNKDLKDALLTAQLELKSNQSEVDAELKRARAEARASVESENGILRQECQTSQEELEKLRKGSQDRIAKLETEGSELKTALVESEAKAKLVSEFEEKVNRLERQLSVARSDGKMAETRCDMLSSQSMDLDSQLEVLRKEKEAIASASKGEKRSSESLKQALDTSQRNLMHATAKSAELARKLADMEAGRDLLVQSRESALKKVEEVVCDCEKIKGELQLCRDAEKEGVDTIGRLENEILRLKALTSGTQGDLDASLKDSINRLQAAAVLEADLKKQLQGKEKEIAELAAKILSVEKSLTAKDAMICQLKATNEKMKVTHDARMSKLKEEAGKPDPVLSTELKDVKKAHAEEILASKKTLTDVKKTLSEQIVTLKQNHAKAMDAAKQSHVKAMESAKQAHVKDSDEAKASNSTAVQALKKKVLDLYKESKRLEGERKTMEAQMRKQEEAARSSAAELEQRLAATNAEKDKLKSKCDELQARNASQEQAARNHEDYVPVQVHEDLKSALQDMKTKVASVEAVLVKRSKSDQETSHLLSQLTGLQQQLRECQSAKAEVDGKLRDAFAERDQLKHQISRGTEQIVAKNAELAESQRCLVECQQRCKHMQANLASKAADLALQKQKLDTAGAEQQEQHQQRVETFRRKSSSPPERSAERRAAVQVGGTSPGGSSKRLDDLHKALMMKMKGLRPKPAAGEDGGAHAENGSMSEGPSAVGAQRKRKIMSEEGSATEVGTEQTAKRNRLDESAGKSVRLNEAESGPVQATPAGASRRGGSASPKSELSAPDSATDQQQEGNTESQQGRRKHTPIVFIQPKPDPRGRGAGRRDRHL
ncbi:hypothetical protein BSKO_00915 [Bryopsis sp. KO-2023]|nr:hypothetical protein BSKO_00915 [Bryopsis sp. KO-2023]